MHSITNSRVDKVRASVRPASVVLVNVAEDVEFRLDALTDGCEKFGASADLASAEETIADPEWRPVRHQYVDSV